MRFIKNAVNSILGPEWFLTGSALRNIHGQYEPCFREFLKLIPKQGTLLDVGANIGITCAIAKRMRPDINLIAFEPVPQNLRILRRIQSIYSIKQLEIYPVALGDSEGTVSIAVPSVGGLPVTGLSHVISDEFNNPLVQCHPFTKIDASMRMLDSFSFQRVDAIKIDVEDHEYHALNGARRLLLTFRPIVLCELWGTANRPRTIELMTSLGYTTAQKGNMDFLFTPNGVV